MIKEMLLSQENVLSVPRSQRYFSLVLSCALFALASFATTTARADGTTDDIYPVGGNALVPICKLTPTNGIKGPNSFKKAQISWDIKNVMVGSIKCNCGAGDFSISDHGVAEFSVTTTCSIVSYRSIDPLVLKELHPTKCKATAYMR